MFRRVGKILVVRDLWIRISFQQVELPFVGHAIVEARVATQEKLAVDSLR
jgi:hypothetical protein